MNTRMPRRVDNAPTGGATGNLEPRAAHVVLVLAALASLGFTLYTGRHNSSLLLVAMFAIWVLSPFVGFFAVFHLAESHPPGIRKAMHTGAIVIALSSVVVYAAVTIGANPMHTAFPFLAVPAASWLGIVPLMVAVRFARRR